MVNSEILVTNQLTLCFLAQLASESNQGKRKMGIVYDLGTLRVNIM